MKTYVFAQLDQAVQDILSSEKKLVYVAGASASGKTYIAEEIAKKLGEQGKTVLTVSSDNYYVDDSGIKSMMYGTYDHPYLIEYDLLAKNIAEYFTNGSFDLPLYSFSESRRMGFKKVAEKADYLLVEGLYTISQLPDNFSPYKIFINASEEDLIIRRLLRDPERVKEPLHMVVTALNNVFPMWHVFGKTQKAQSDVEILNDYDLLEKSGKKYAQKTFDQQDVIGKKEYKKEEEVVEYIYNDKHTDDGSKLIISEYYQGSPILKSVGISKQKFLTGDESRSQIIAMRIYKPGVLTQIHNLVQNAGLVYEGQEKYNQTIYMDENEKLYAVEERHDGVFISNEL